MVDDGDCLVVNVMGENVYQGGIDNLVFLSEHGIL